METIIIGAGLSGLATAAALARSGVRHTLLESEGAVAASWRRRHPQLRLNTHRWLSRLPGLDYPRGTDGYPRRDDVVRYLVAYAQQLGSRIEFGTAVHALCRADGGWRVHTSRGSRTADHVVVATGRDRVPHVPPWPGLRQYARDFLHAANFGPAGRYAGRSVLVVGGGNSAFDVLNHLSRVATRELRVSVRTGPVILPLAVAGVPLQPTTLLLRRLPVPLQDAALGLTHSALYGDLPAFGLPAPSRGGAARLRDEGVAPAVDAGFARALRRGQAHVVPEIAGFTEHAVHLVDGSVLAPDVVIAATGYRADLEPLAGGLDILDERGLPQAACGCADARAPGLWFVGMRPDPAGYFRAAREGANRIARALAADARMSPAHEKQFRNTNR